MICTQGSAFGVQRLGFRGFNCGFGFRVYCSGTIVYGLGFRDWALGFRVQD